ncbi:uncharacterized protein LOC115091127 [Rhinatrema bivittatum]|uniref:uncharacterized protein LOC115091127 n=1 Tax=Rhinatrema bivittatum TaxID=194408 RepID=UPI00112B4F35|nr:uncharacterized protein LOC115091127 [Rhinatrema bivittatum]
MPSQRILDLAKPRRDFSKQEINSQCQDSQNLKKIWDVPSKRILYLAEPRKVSEQRSLDSSDLNINRAALRYDISERMLILSRPKSVHSHCQVNTEGKNHISEPAIQATATARVEQLAQPKVRKNLSLYDIGRPETPIRLISSLTKNAKASARTARLAEPRVVPSDCKPARNVPWSVSIKTKLAVPTSRTVELSQPIQRKRKCQD